MGSKLRILITGHAGFVGSLFYKRLTSDGHQVIGADINAVDSKFRMDARDLFRYSDTKFDLVFHFAAIVGGRETIENNPLKVATDLAIDADLWQWALRTRPGRVIYYSSSAVYPNYLQTPERDHRLTEADQDINDFRQPDLTYGFAKLAGEYQAQFVQQAGIPVSLFRPFSGYGETQSLDYPFPSFIDRARRRVKSFDIWGDGEQARDFIHIDDIYGATMAAIENDVRGPINLGWGRKTTFNQLAEMCLAVSGQKAEINHLTEKPVGVMNRVSDNTKMLSFYQPKVTLEHGIARSLDYSPKT